MSSIITKALRFPWCLFAGALLLLTLTACSGTPEQRAALHTRRAKTYVAQSNFKGAILEYEIASQNMPKDAEPVYQMGLIFLAANSTKQAFEQFEKAAALNPNHVGAAVQLAQMKAASDRLDVVQEAERSLNALLASHPGDREITGPLALVEAKLGNKAEAWKLLLGTLQKNPSNIRPAAVVVGYYTSKGDTATAKQFACDLSNALPKSPELAVLRGQVSFATQDFVDTDAQVSRALALKRDFAPALDLRLRRELAGGDSAAAEQTTQEISKLPQDGTKDAYGRMLFAEGKVDQGIAEFNRLLKEHKDDLPLRDEYSYYLLKAQRRSEARAVIEGTLQKDANHRPALLERATLNIDLGNLDAAAKDIKSLRDMQANSAELCLQESRIYGARGQTSRQGDLLVEALRYNARLLKARTQLANLLSNTGQAKNALATLDQATPQEKNTLEYVFSHNTALIADANFAEARKGVDKGLAAAPHAPEFLRQDGVIRLFTHDLAGSRKSFEEAFQLAPTDTGTLTLLGQVMKQQNEGPQFLSLVRDAAAKNPKSAPLQRFLGIEFVKQGDVKSGRAALEAAKTAGDVVDADNDLADLDMRTGQLNAAEQRLLNLVKTHDNPHSRFLLAQIETAKGTSPDTVAAQYLKVLDLDPSNVLAMNNLADTLAEDPKKLDDALFWAKKALGVAPANLLPAVEDSIGWIYFKAGKYDDALAYLEKSLRGKDRPLAHYHLAGALLKAGDPARGRTEYEVALKQNPNDGARGEVGPLFERR